MYNDTARGGPLQPDNFAASFCPAYRAEFLGLGQNPWHVAHLTRFSRKGFDQGKDNVSEYFERRFIYTAARTIEQSAIFNRRSISATPRPN